MGTQNDKKQIKIKTARKLKIVSIEYFGKDRAIFVGRTSFTWEEQ